MRTRYLVYLLLLSLPLTSSLCPTAVPQEPDTCDAPSKIVEIDTVVRPGGSFYFQAPPAENECHGVYEFTWRYLDDVDALTDETMPPLENLPKGFGPAAEFSYFAHPLPVHSVNSLGQHEWRITFDAGNKHSSQPSTEHSISVQVPTEQENPKAKGVVIYAGIVYVPKE